MPCALALDAFSQCGCSLRGWVGPGSVRLPPLPLARALGSAGSAIATASVGLSGCELLPRFDKWWCVVHDSPYTNRRTRLCRADLVTDESGPGTGLSPGWAGTGPWLSDWQTNLLTPEWAKTKLEQQRQPKDSNVGHVCLYILYTNIYARYIHIYVYITGWVRAEMGRIRQRATVGQLMLIFRCFGRANCTLIVSISSTHRVLWAIRGMRGQTPC